jgi:HNH endonuclease
MKVFLSDSTMLDPEVCPYCERRPTGADQDVYSDDHIFPESMGGKRTIRACKSCNDTFGHSFEVQNLDQTIIPLSVMLGRAGVSIVQQDIRWRRVFTTPDGQVYNLLLTQDGLQPVSAKPLVKRDADDPKLLHVTINNDPESRRHLKQFNNPKRFVLKSETPGQPTRIQESSFELNLNKAVGLTALKMAFAGATIAFPGEISSFKDARLDLREAQEDSRMRTVVIDHRTHTSLDRSRGALCHTIYIEEYEGIVHSIVQFFGCFQCSIRLSDSVSRSYENGLLATLDPTTGEEMFREIPRLRIRKWTGDEAADQLSSVKKFNEYARQKGAKSIALDVTAVTGGDGVVHTAKSSLVGWSWTGDIPGHKK